MQSYRSVAIPTSHTIDSPFSFSPTGHLSTCRALAFCRPLTHETQNPTSSSKHTIAVPAYRKLHAQPPILKIRGPCVSTHLSLHQHSHVSHRLYSDATAAWHACCPDAGHKASTAHGKVCWYWPQVFHVTSCRHVGCVGACCVAMLAIGFYFSTCLAAVTFDSMLDTGGSR